ncbi:translocation/assembly module TamB domain-containing protein [Hymenobacter humi]
MYQFAAAPEQVINYEKWSAGPNNYVRYYPTGAVVADGLRLTNGRSTLALQSQNPAVATSPLGVTFNNFELAELARIVQQQDSLVAGTLNGTARIDNLGTKRQAFTADATVSNLVFQKAVIGDIAVKATNPAPSRYDVDARLTGGAAGSVGGSGNDVRLTGSYLASSATPLNFVVEANRFNLKLVEPFSVGQVRSATGFVRGRLTVAGAPAAPQVRGTLTTSDDAGFVVPQLGSPFRLPGQDLTFDDRGIAFNNFTVLDSASNKAVANGYLLTKDFVNYTFDMRATTNNFMAVRSTRANNELFYGRLVLDSETRLTGPLTLIKVDTRVTVVEGSNLTVESPSATPTTVAREGIVEFIDVSAPLDTMLARNLALDTVKVDATGYDVTAVVTVTSRTPFTIVIDPASGDNLRVRADGTLNTNIAPDGTITLTGRLDVARGQYHMSLYDLAERDFIISRGSSITWDGDPYNAALNVTAIYKVQAAPAELLASQGEDDPTSNTVSRNRLPFNVLLNVTDQLSKPTIGFDITLPENQRGALDGQVEAKLAQPAPAQPEFGNEQAGVFAAGSGPVCGPKPISDQQRRRPGGHAAARQCQRRAHRPAQHPHRQVSLGRGPRPGPDQPGRLQHRRSPQPHRPERGRAPPLLNNRLTVRVGTDIGLSGNTGSTVTQGQSAASNFAGDISLEYLVLPDGRLRVRVFRQNAFEDIDGQIVRTGAALVFQRDYRDLKELFSKVPESIKEQRKVNRKVEKVEKKAEKDSVQSQPTARVDTSRTKAARR